MATLQQLETALVNANKAGDMDAVRRLAPIIKKERDERDAFNTALDPRTGQRVKIAPIPGMENGIVPGTTPGPPKTTVGEKIVGLGENALSIGTGATSGTIGLLGGTLKGLVDNIISGKYGTAEGADEAARTAEAGARALTYEPKTEAGRQQAEVLGEGMKAAAPLVGMAPELAVLSETAGAVRPVVRAAAREKVVAPIQQAATTLAEQVKQKIVAPAAEATPGTGKSAGSAAVDQATLRQAAADELPVKMKLTEGQKTRDFEQQRFERETAKLGEVGEPIRQRFQEQNLQLQQNMDAFIDATGAELTDVRNVGEVVDKALRSRAARDKTKIRALYKEADKAGEMKVDVDLNPVTELLKESESARSVAPILTATEQEMNRLAALHYTGRGGDRIKLTLSDAEQLRKFVNKVTGADPTNIKFAADIKKAIDAATEGKGGELYKKAREARAQYANDYENFGLAKRLLNTKRGSTDRAIAMEDVLNKSVVSPAASLDTVTKLRQLLETEGPAGQQAWKELQGGMLRHIRDEALKGVTTDSAGNRVVSAGALDKAVNALDKSGKLDYVLGKKQAEQIRTVNEVAKYVTTSPPGVVNTSNTATVLAGLLDVAISGTTGVPAPVASTFRLVTSKIKDAKLKARVQKALGE